MSVVTGCATTTPFQQTARIEQGIPIDALDELAEGFAIADRLLLWNDRLENHKISQETIGEIAHYLEQHSDSLGGLVVRVNQWKPQEDFIRLWTNPYVAWPYRLLFGLPLTLTEAVLPGRLVPGAIVGYGDHYNPYTNTVHLYSDDPAIAIHELDVANDAMRQPDEGYYAFTRMVPWLGACREADSTRHTLDYFRREGKLEGELRAYTSLYPALGGSFASIPGVLVGHVTGRMDAAARRRFIPQREPTPVLEPPPHKSQPIASPPPPRPQPTPPRPPPKSPPPPAAVVTPLTPVTPVMPQPKPPVIHQPSSAVSIPTMSEIERSYLEELYTRIYANMPILPGRNGEVQLQVTVGRFGDLKDVRIVEARSNIDAIMRRSALLMVQDAFPLTPFPPTWPGEHRFQLSIHFRFP